MPQIVAPPESQPQSEPIITTCQHCHYTISYTEDEVERVENDGIGIVCPNCNEPVITEQIKPFTFPKTFYHFGSGDDGNLPSILSDEETQKYVDIVKRTLQQERKIGEYTFTGTGDTMVFGFKFEDEDVIFVAKNYWEDSVFRY